MKDGTHITRVMCFLFCTILLSTNLLHAQSSRERESQNQKEELLQGIDRWSFKTNALDWLLTIPNAGVEFDLSSSPYNRSTIGLSGRYNWNTWHKFKPSTVFDIWEIKPEYRYYWKPRPKGPRSGRAAISVLIERDNPKEWRAYWLGLYTSYGGYGMKFFDLGWQGVQAGAGLTFGYGMPLYDWKDKGTIDVEFGVSVGCMFSENENFTHNADGGFYSYVQGSHRDWHLLPFPVMSEIRVAFAYRTKSIKDKYTKVDQTKIRERQDREYQEQLDREEAEAIRAEKEAEKLAQKKAKADAKAAKEQERIEWENMSKEEKKAATAQRKADEKAAKEQKKADKKAGKADKKVGKAEKKQTKSEKKGKKSEPETEPETIDE